MQRLDIMGRLDRVVDPNNNVISYTYDRFGNRTQIAGPHGTLKYTYDQLGRIETVTDQQGNVTRYAYDELGRQKKIACANGTETLYTYDTLSRLTGVVNRKTIGEIITSHKYTLDAAGHRIKIEEAGSSVEYGYDKLNRLTSEKRNGVVTLDDGYTYDPVGNRLTKASLGGNSSYTYDENDRLKSDGKYTYGWDENGNLTSRTGSDGSTTYKYDPENRLIEASGSNGTVQFAYDAQGNRIGRTTSSGTTTFVVDPNMPYAQVLEENGPAGAKVYAYGNDMLNMQGPEGARWFAYDGLGSTRALTDSTGTLTDAYTYEAFGTVVHRTGTSANEFQFTGEQYEAALDMYYLRARYYEPGTGRFGARDPYSGAIDLPQTLHSYEYCASDPANRNDLSGRIFEFTSGGLAISQSVQRVLSGMNTLRVMALTSLILPVFVAPFVFMAVDTSPNEEIEYDDNDDPEEKKPKRLVYRGLNPRDLLNLATKGFILANGLNQSIVDHVCGLKKDTMYISASLSFECASVFTRTTGQIATIRVDTANFIDHGLLLLKVIGEAAPLAQKLRAYICAISHQEVLFVGAIARSSIVNISPGI